MALSNLDRVNKGLDLLRKGLLPYVEKEMKAEYKQYWDMEAVEGFPSGYYAKNQSPEEWDVNALLQIMLKHWQKVFGRVLGFSEKSWISELIEIRKRAAHQNKNNVFAVLPGSTELWPLICVCICSLTNTHIHKQIRKNN